MNTLPLDESVRVAVYAHFAREGTAPPPEALGVAVGQPPDRVHAALQRLAALHHLALHPDTGALWMAHPFSAVPTDYPVLSAKGVRYWANCVWDAFAIPSLLGLDATVECHCPDCGSVQRLEFDKGRCTSGEGIAHFLVPAREMWDDIGFT